MSHTRERVEHLLRRWEFRNDAVEIHAKDKTFWKSLSDYWHRFARMLGRANALVLLTVVYILVIGPGAVFLKLFRKDLLDRRMEERASYWYDKAPVDQDVDRSKHQF